MEKCPREANPECREKLTFQRVFVAVSCRQPTPTLFSPASSAELPLHRAGSTHGKIENGTQKKLPSHTDIMEKKKKNKRLEKKKKDWNMDTPSETTARCLHRWATGDWCSKYFLLPWRNTSICGLLLLEMTTNTLKDFKTIMVKTLWVV